MSDRQLRRGPFPAAVAGFALRCVQREHSVEMFKKWSGLRPAADSEYRGGRVAAERQCFDKQQQQHYSQSRLQLLFRGLQPGRQAGRVVCKRGRKPGGAVRVEREPEFTGLY